MKLTFILPSVDRREGKEAYLNLSWHLEPLAIAHLAGLTPKDIKVRFFDDRVESIDYDEETDLVGITVETYTARRAYEISSEYRKRGVKVILGGFHPTLFPEEAQRYADAIVVGNVEDSWASILADAKENRLKKVYKSDHIPALDKFPDRSIFGDRKYVDFGLIQIGRGCQFNCEFCSICRFHNHTYQHRPIEDVITELKGLDYRYYFFIDDNLCTDFDYAKKLFKALAPLKLKWMSQAGLNIARDPELLGLMKESGCELLLVGIESLNDQVLDAMNKRTYMGLDRDWAVGRIHDAGIKICATFVLGYDEDTAETFEEAYQFALKHKFFLTFINHLVPFPGTAVYDRLKAQNRLLSDAWWLDPAYTPGGVMFKPKNFTPEELDILCYNYRRKVYSGASIARRLFNLKTNLSIESLFLYAYINLFVKYGRAIVFIMPGPRV